MCHKGVDWGRVIGTICKTLKSTQGKHPQSTRLLRQLDLMNGSGNRLKLVDGEGGKKGAAKKGNCCLLATPFGQEKVAPSSPVALWNQTYLGSRSGHESSELSPSFAPWVAMALPSVPTVVVPARRGQACDTARLISAAEQSRREVRSAMEDLNRLSNDSLRTHSQTPSPRL